MIFLLETTLVRKEYSTDVVGRVDEDATAAAQVSISKCYIMWDSLFQVKHLRPLLPIDEMDETRLEPLAYSNTLSDGLNCIRTILRRPRRNSSC